MISFSCEEHRRLRLQAYPNWPFMSMEDRMMVMATEAIEDEPCPDCRVVSGIRGLSGERG